MDIVNLGMAELSDSPAILVGDIDRGGVFAALYGTIMLLDEAERRRIRGVVINKFRGDVEILKPGLKMLEDLTGIPVLGVVPYLPLELDDEDSLSERLMQKKADESALLDVAVIRLPRISNFTDFEALERWTAFRFAMCQSAANWECRM
ncbi:MAG: AAA family ATPase [Ruminococcus sp.]